MTATTHADTIPMPADGAVPTIRLVAPPPPARQPGRTRGYWGVLCLIATEATIFTGLLATYFFLRASSPVWPQGGIKVPELTTISIMSVILVGSSLPIFLAEHAINRGGVNTMRVCLMLAFLMGAAFLGHEGYEYAHLEFNWTKNAYSSIFYVTTGLHGMHVLIGLLINLQVQIEELDGEDHDRAPHLAGGVRPLLALRRRRVDLRVLVALRLGAHQMSTVAPPRLHTWWYWLVATAPVGFWMVHLVFSAAVATQACDSDWRWTLYAITPVTAVPTLACMAVSWHLRRTRSGSEPGSQDAQLSFLGTIGLVVGAFNLLLILAEGALVPVLSGCG